MHHRRYHHCNYYRKLNRDRVWNNWNRMEELINGFKCAIIIICWFVMETFGCENYEVFIFLNHVIQCNVHSIWLYVRVMNIEIITDLEWFYIIWLFIKNENGTWNGEWNYNEVRRGRKEQRKGEEIKWKDHPKPSLYIVNIETCLNWIRKYKSDLAEFLVLFLYVSKNLTLNSSFSH